MSKSAECQLVSTEPIDDSARWLEDNSVGDVVITPEGQLVDYNHAAARMFRLAPDQDIRGRNILDLCVEHRFDEMIRALHVTGRLENWDARFFRLDGTPLRVVVNLVGTFDAERRLASIRAHLFNISEWTRAQQRSNDRERLDAIGRLAGGLAHDFSNLLTVITGHVERLTLGLAPGDPLRGSALAIQDASARAATLTRQLLAFGRRQVLEARPLDVNAIVTRVEADVRRTFGHRIRVELDLARSLWTVQGDAGQIEQAFGTLAGRAVDAMALGGTLRFRTRNIEIDEVARQARSWLDQGPFVEVVVADGGDALDQAWQARLFEPFSSGVGGGLGLAAVYGIVKQSGGYVWVESEAHVGTSVTVLLPAAVGRAAGPEPETVRSARATILVVDDDEAVRSLVVQVLGHAGYRVLEADSGEQGERLFDDREMPVDLLITDVVMGGMSGRQFGQRLCALSPSLKVLYISGYPDERPPAGADSARIAFLEKPFSMRSLVARVERLLFPA